MRTLRQMPIRQKLLVTVMVTMATALVFSGTAIVILDAVLFRAAMERDLAALASIAGDNSTAALLFDDPRVAADTLATLRERPHIVGACVYRANGTVLARYTRPGAPSECPPPSSTPAIHTTGDVTVTRPILLDNRRIGTIVLRYDLGEIAERTKLYGRIVLGILLTSSLIAFLLSARLRAVIAMPISRLAQAATSVSATGDYAIRVPKDTDDELGVLVDAFNGMLAGIQSQAGEIREARNLLQTTLTSIGDAVISTDDQGRVVFANPVAQALLRWPAQELAGKPLDDVFQIINEFTRSRVVSPVARVLREGIIVGLANHTLLIARDGTEVPIDDSAAPILEDGRIIGVVLVFRDISERRRAQQDNAWLASLVESSEDAIIGKSPEGVIQSWNAAAERLYGYTAAEVIGHPMAELLPPERRHEESGILERIRHGGRIVHFETVRTRKDGTPVDLSLTISPIRDKTGQLVGISHVARDITEQKRSAEQLRQTQKLESLGILAGGIAHDFNNLLTGILGGASLLTETLPPQTPEWKCAEQISTAAERAGKLTQQMLAYSGRGRFVVEPIDVSRHVREIAALIQASIPKNVELRLQLAKDLPLIEADAAQLQQLVMNLLINGAEAIGPEGGLLTILTRLEETAVAEAPRAPYVVIEVQDTGCGMDETTLSRIFDPFFTTKFTGRGLGLAAVQGIVRGHKGTIQVHSTPGLGTTFRILLPAAGSPALPGEPHLPAMRALSGTGIVLVVDDEEVVRYTAKKALEKVGYEVVLAADGREAVQVFRTIAPKVFLVLLDMTMPGMTGEETLRLLREIREDVPIMLSSGYSEAEALRRFSNLNLAGFLQKPYTVRTLAEKLKSVS